MRTSPTWSAVPLVLVLACSFADDPCNGEDWIGSGTPVLEGDDLRAWNDAFCTPEEESRCHAVLPQGSHLLRCSHDGHAVESSEDDASFDDATDAARDAGASGIRMEMALHCQYRSSGAECTHKSSHTPHDLPIPPPGH